VLLSSGRGRASTAHCSIVASTAATEISSAPPAFRSSQTSWYVPGLLWKRRGRQWQCTRTELPRDCPQLSTCCQTRRPRSSRSNSPVCASIRLSTSAFGHFLPAVTFIDPAMHTLPQNDDHPPTDMYRGQMVLLRTSTTSCARTRPYGSKPTPALLCRPDGFQGSAFQRALRSH
jgi:hypothetical protein